MKRAPKRPAKSKKFNYVYITTNIINGHQYVGEHSTDNMDDGYIGSGKLIISKIKQYGKINFKKEVLENFDNKEDAFNAQMKYIKLYKTHVSQNGYNKDWTGGWHPINFFDSPDKIKSYCEDLKDVFNNFNSSKWA